MAELVSYVWTVPHMSQCGRSTFLRILSPAHAGLFSPLDFLRRGEHQPVASYSAGRDNPAKLISDPSTGTKLDIAANDQIRPIATTTAIPTIHARICIPSTSR